MKNIKLFFLSLISILIFVEHSDGQIIPNIVGGTGINISQVPWQVLIHLSGTDECGGVIISPNWIVTCGHCVFNPITGTVPPVSLFTVYAGITDRSNKSVGQVRSVDRIILHPGFDFETGANDIALIHLSTALTYNTNVNRIPVATQNDVNAGYTDPGVVAHLSGWGYTSTGGSQPNILQGLNETIIANNALNPNVYLPFIITDNNLAAGGVPNQGACNGDSGGALTVVGANGITILAGLVDHGDNSGNCATTNPDIYVRISGFSNFIAQNTSTVTGTQPCCADFPTTYTLASLIPVSNVTWTTSSDFTPNAGNGINATISSSNASSTTGTITYNFSTPQGGGIIHAFINVGNGQTIYANLTNDGQNELGTVNSVSSGQTTVFVNPISTPSFTWFLMGSGINWVPNGNGSSMTFVLNNNQSGTWSVTANNRCSSYRDLTFTTQFHGYGFDIIKQRGNVITIKARPPLNVHRNSVYSFNIQVYSLTGSKILNMLNNLNSASFNANNLPKGNYKIVISKNTDQVSIPLSIN